MTVATYDRSALVQVLIYHPRMQTGSCLCGWGERPEHLGYSHAEHVADIYEQTIAEDVRP